MKKWEYGNYWEKYPIEEGQLWVDTVTGSILSVCDITKHVPSFFVPDIIYCDPPWDLGNANSFLTKNESGYYLSSFSEFYNKLFEIIKNVKPSVCYLEIGKRNLKVFQNELSNIYNQIQTWEVTYYKKNKSYLIRGSESKTDFDFTGMDDMDTPFAAIKNEQCKSVGDLCTGRGLTAVAALANNKRFYGVELNKRRMAVTIDRMIQRGSNFKIK